MEKKALSTVVVTVILILISILAIAVLYYAIRPVVKEGTEAAASKADCLLLSYTVESAKYTDASDSVLVTVKRGTDQANGKVTALKFMVDTTLKDALTNTPPSSALTQLNYNITGVTTQPAKVALVAYIGDVICDPVEEKTVL